MPNTPHARRRRFLAGFVGLLTLIAICGLGYAVVRELQILQPTRADNAKWSLAQTEVEFLDFANALAVFEETPTAIRQKFDIFYSRINTIEAAAVYQTLREDSHFSDALRNTRGFLDVAVPLVDLPDQAFIQQHDALNATTQDARILLRQLSNAGLTVFSANADAQRAAVATTLTILVVALSVFIGALGLSIVYLSRLNSQNILRRRAQKEIATRMNTIIETSLDGVIVSDDQGTILEFSSAAETIFGYRADLAIGRNFSELMIPDALQASTLNIVGAGRVRLDAKRQDGSIFPIEVSIQSAQSGNRQINIAFLRDVSSVVDAEQDLVTARDAALKGDKLKTDFLATMSHEIRTPLNGLLGNLALLHGTKVSPQQNRYIRNMETSGKLLMAHISDVLDITRYDTGNLPIRIVPMNVSVLVQDIIDNQSAMAETANTTLAWNWRGPARNWVMSDPDCVQLILINLISNAVKFTKGGHVTVSAEVMTTGSAINQVRFRVTDTGPGIAPNLLKRIFDDFVTGNAAYDRDVGGTGLGLSIAKRFAVALGGTIDVQSKVGAGSTFEVILPMPPAQLTSDHTIGGQAVQKTPPLSILIVEDNDINRTVAREMLESAGHIVTEAYDGKDGVTKADAQRFDMIFMDISMPVMDGRTAAREIKAGNGQSATTPIIALTAHALASDQASFADDGMIATLTKPLSKQGLLSVLSDAHPTTDTLYASPAFQKLKLRFVAEMDAFLIVTQSGESTFADLEAQAHHAAGSAATFQDETVAAPLRRLATAAREADADKITIASQAFSQAWTDARPVHHR